MKKYYIGSFVVEDKRNVLKCSYKTITRFSEEVIGFPEKKPFANGFEVHFKIEANAELLSSKMPLYRDMLEELLNVKIYDFSLSDISYEEYLKRENPNKKTSHHHELSEVIKDLEGYKKQFKNISVEGFDYKVFSKASKKVIAEMKKLLESDVFVKKTSDFRYFSFELREAQKKLILSEISELPKGEEDD